MTPSCNQPTACNQVAGWGDTASYGLTAFNLGGVVGACVQDALTGRLAIGQAVGDEGLSDGIAHGDAWI